MNLDIIIQEKDLSSFVSKLLDNLKGNPATLKLDIESQLAKIILIDAEVSVIKQSIETLTFSLLSGLSLQESLKGIEKSFEIGIESHTDPNEKRHELIFELILDRFQKEVCKTAIEYT